MFGMRWRAGQLLYIRPYKISYRVSNMRPNPEREAKILRHWKEEVTIDKISILEGIPRSSVGYYVKKFRRKYGSSHRQDIPKPVLQDISRSKDEQIIWARFLVDIQKKLGQLLAEGKYREVVDFVEAYFALKRLINDIGAQVQGEEEITAENVLENFFKYKLP